MHPPKWATAAATCACIGLALAPPARAQTLHGTVVDASNGYPVALAGVYLLDNDRNHLAVAMADSVGRYFLAVPDRGDYFLWAQRFGYVDLESPLLAISADRDYPLDLEMRPEPIGLEPMTVTVQNDQVMEWLTLELGENPSAAFGFRLLQGARLQQAKARARNNPTETLRWLYIPVSHGLECVSINSVPRAQSVSWFRGPRTPGFTPGGTPVGTRSLRDIAESVEGGRGCGSLIVDDLVVPNEHIESIDMSSVAVIVTLPGSVRMYTYGFTGGFRRR